MKGGDNMTTFNTTPAGPDTTAVYYIDEEGTMHGITLPNEVVEAIRPMH